MVLIIAILIYLILTVPVGIFGYLTGWLFIPLGLITKHKIFWIWMDDSRFDSDRPSGLAEDYELYLLNNKRTFWKEFIWIYRQNMWNLKLLLFKKGKEKDLEYIYDKLKRNGVGVYDRSYHPVESAGLKFIDANGNEGWNVNRGLYISKKYSTLGVSLKTHRVGWIPSFRYSHCIETPLGWWTLKLGDNRKRFVFNMKIQKKVDWR